MANLKRRAYELGIVANQEKGERAHVGVGEPSLNGSKGIAVYSSAYT